MVAVIFRGGDMSADTRALTAKDIAEQIIETSPSIALRTVLVGGRWVDYPHVIEHEGNLFIAFAGGKQTIEVLRVKLNEVAALKMPESPLTQSPKR